MFTLGGGTEFFKPGMDSLGHAPFDLFGSFDSGLGGATSSGMPASAPAAASTSASTTSTNTNSPFSIGAIDPQLVGTPAVSTAADSQSEAGGADPESDDEESKGLFVAPVKVGGKGKARRGTLHSGGVSKKSALPGPQSIFGSLSAADSPSGVAGRGAGKGGKISSAVKISSKEKNSKDKDQDDDDGRDDDPDDWRPTPEEYAKMSSKEKRQLRNKISARNFRIRRKGKLLFRLHLKFLPSLLHSAFHISRSFFALHTTF